MIVTLSTQYHDVTFSSSHPLRFCLLRMSRILPTRCFSFEYLGRFDLELGAFWSKLDPLKCLSRERERWVGPWTSNAKKLNGWRGTRNGYSHVAASVFSGLMISSTSRSSRIFRRVSIHHVPNILSQHHNSRTSPLAHLPVHFACTVCSMLPSGVCSATSARYLSSTCKAITVQINQGCASKWEACDLRKPEVRKKA